MLTDEQRAALERLRKHQSLPFDRINESPYWRTNGWIDDGMLFADMGESARLAMATFQPGVEPISCYAHIENGRMIHAASRLFEGASSLGAGSANIVRGYFIPQPKREETQS